MLAAHRPVVFRCSGPVAVSLVYSGKKIRVNARFRVIQESKERTGEEGVDVVVKTRRDLTLFGPRQSCSSSSTQSNPNMVLPPYFTSEIKAFRFNCFIGIRPYPGCPYPPHVALPLQKLKAEILHFVSRIADYWLLVLSHISIGFQLDCGSQHETSSSFHPDLFINILRD